MPGDATEQLPPPNKHAHDVKVDKALAARVYARNLKWDEAVKLVTLR